MNDAAPDLAFRETMSGPFALGETDPVRGAAKGRVARTPLTMHCSIAMTDIAGFVRDPAHEATLAGAISFAPLGGRLAADKGALRLFAPGGVDDARKVMFYGMHVSGSGRPLYAVGRKQVAGRSLVAMWPETTTLYTRLHDGADETAAVIGAGILRLSPIQLLQTLPTMRPSNRANALVKFGTFFVAQLWDSYVVRGARASDSGSDARRV